MKIPSWMFPFLSLLVSQGFCLKTGFGVAISNPATTPVVIGGQPSPVDFSLDLDFFVKVNDYEFNIPIMPLHLLGKKSWNVYNTANIEKVRKDEAIAAAAEAEEEERMQALDAERRLQILRGKEPTPLAIEDAPRPSSESWKDDREPGFGREKKRRKKFGENDTDFEMRVVREKAEEGRDVDKSLVLRKVDADAPLTDSRGHISLFPQEVKKRSEKEKNPEAEKEAERKKKEYEDQYTMRFSNAAGFKQNIGEAPWYEKGGKGDVEDDLPGKDVWGNEDPRRKQRELERVVSSDPLAMMKAGARKVRQVEKERKKWKEERERELRELEEAEARERRRKRKRRLEDDEDDLESFRLDGGDDDDRSSSRRREDRDRDREWRHRHKSSRRSSHRDEDRHRHRNRHRSHD